jgi:NAD+ kinase
VIKVEIGGRAENFLLTLDHHRTELPNPTSITISKENFTIKTVRFADRDFFAVIREKLMWGFDKRNE